MGSSGREKKAAAGGLAPASDAGASLAFLDIETTGLSPFSADLTVAGICVVGRNSSRTVQLVGAEITCSALEELLFGAGTVYTFNGKRFDLAFIKRKLGLDIGQGREHEDLMYECWRRNLYGGLKAVEKRLGIKRKLPDISGLDAVMLWESYLRGNKTSLRTLLEYNREDVENLVVLKRKLGL